VGHPTKIVEETPAVAKGIANVVNVRSRRTTVLTDTVMESDGFRLFTCPQSVDVLEEEEAEEGSDRFGFVRPSVQELGVS
jgi:hypothetical protein